MIPVIATIAIGGITLAIAKCCFNRSVNVSSSNGRAIGTASSEVQTPTIGLMDRQIEIDSNYIESKKQEIQALGREKDQLIKQLDHGYRTVQYLKDRMVLMGNRISCLLENNTPYNDEEATSNLATYKHLSASQFDTIITDKDALETLKNLQAAILIQDPNKDQKSQIKELSQSLESQLKLLSKRNSNLKEKKRIALNALYKIQTHCVSMKSTLDGMDAALGPTQTIEEEK